MSSRSVLSFEPQVSELAPTSGFTIAYRVVFASANYILRGSIEGNVFAKTGTINGVSTLSGYAKAVSGKVYAFSILFNQVRSNAGAHAAQDRIVAALIDRG